MAMSIPLVAMILCLKHCSSYEVSSPGGPPTLPQGLPVMQQTPLLQSQPPAQFQIPANENDFRQHALEMGSRLSELLRQEITFLSKISNTPITDLDRITIPGIMSTMPSTASATQSSPSNQITINTYGGPFNQGGSPNNNGQCSCTPHQCSAVQGPPPSNYQGNNPGIGQGQRPSVGSPIQSSLGIDTVVQTDLGTFPVHIIPVEQQTQANLPAGGPGKSPPLTSSPQVIEEFVNTAQGPVSVHIIPAESQIQGNVPQETKPEVFQNADVPTKPVESLPPLPYTFQSKPIHMNDVFVNTSPPEPEQPLNPPVAASPSGQQPLPYTFQSKPVHINEVFVNTSPQSEIPEQSPANPPQQSQQTINPTASIGVNPLAQQPQQTMNPPVAANPIAQQPQQTMNPPVAANPIAQQPQQTINPPVPTYPIAQQPQQIINPPVVANPVAQQPQQMFNPTVDVNPVVQQPQHMYNPTVGVNPVAQQPQQTYNPNVGVNPVAQLPQQTYNPSVGVNPVALQPQQTSNPLAVNPMTLPQTINPLASSNPLAAPPTPVYAQPSTQLVQTFQPQTPGLVAQPQTIMVEPPSQALPASTAANAPATAPFNV